MGNILKHVLLILAITGTSAVVYAQRKVDKIQYKADELEYGKKNGERYRKLTNNVVFTQKSTTIYCDSSFFYKKRNEMDSYGDVRIIDDSTTITSFQLLYNGTNRTAKLRDEVVYKRGKKRLYTDFLDYDIEREVANYFNNGKLIDTTNILTSEIGFFYAKADYALFQNNVVLTTPDFVLKADTMKYNTITKIVYTYGLTEVITEDGSTLVAQGGEFRTLVDQSEFKDGYVETPDYYLEGDQLYFDDIKKYYRAKGNVKLTAKNNDLVIIGNEGYYDKYAGESKIYGLPLMKRILEQDTLYLAADTLMALESQYDSLKRILAYYDVKIFKRGLQGVADSMAYFQQDSIIYFYNDPVMWNTKNQITSDSINLEIKNQTVDRMNLRKDAFIVSMDTLQNFNQIKGRDMTAFFSQDQIDHINVNGNGEMLYYGLEEGDSVLMGMNKIFCSDMRILFDNQQLTQFKVYQNPEAKFIPPHELTEDVQRLNGFNWRIEERPKLFEVAYYLNPALNYDSLLLADTLVTRRVAEKSEEREYNNNANTTRTGPKERNGRNDAAGRSSANGFGRESSFPSNSNNGSRSNQNTSQNRALRERLEISVDDQ